MSGKKKAGSRRPGFTGLQGVWRSRGYGYLLEISSDGYVLHEETGVSCLPIYRGTLPELAEHYADLHVSAGGRSFSARRVTGVTRVGFRRLRTLPRKCAQAAARPATDPRYNFEVFWHTFAENYALFPLKKVNWQTVHNRYLRRVTPDLPEEELFDLLCDMLRPLHDGHIHLHTSFGDFSAARAPDICQRLTEELQEAEDWQDTLSYLAELRAWQRETIREDYLGGQTRQGGHRLLEWGRLDAHTGYLAIRAMAGLCGRPGRAAQDLAAAGDAMRCCIDDLRDLPRLVLDLRGNGGGYDGVALRLAGYFLERPHVAFIKSARNGDAFTGRQKVRVEPSAPDPYDGELVVLISGLTASAAEIFVLALLQRPRLTLIGEPTQGILSDTLERHLPNGWSLTLSNEIYRAFDGTHYEHHGIPPHVGIPYLDLESRVAGRDPMLDYILQR